MRYYYEPTKERGICPIASIHKCDHPLYDKCTLYFKDGIGLGVIQQRYNSTVRCTWWGPIDRHLIWDIYSQDDFEKVFEKRAGEPVDGVYPMMTVRQLMWAVGMKPLRKHRWETIP